MLIYKRKKTTKNEKKTKKNGLYQKSHGRRSITAVKTTHSVVRTDPAGADETTTGRFERTQGTLARASAPAKTSSINNDNGERRQSSPAGKASCAQAEIENSCERTDAQWGRRPKKVGGNSETVSFRVFWGAKFGKNYFKNSKFKRSANITSFLSPKS